MKLIEVIANSGSADTVAAVAAEYQAHGFRKGAVDEQHMQSMRLLVADDKVQAVLDTLQNAIGAQSTARILVIPIEATIPRASDEERKQERTATAAREALYDSAAKNTRLNLNYMVLVMLSTVVAAIGLIENNVAVLIGAMVIAPLLGPNIALGLGTALGDVTLMHQALVTTVAGIILAVALSLGIGIFWPFTLSSPELLARTEAGIDSVALALASGAAAALSLTTGLPSVLVGVMVAVALLPPAATLGLMLGQGNLELAGGAGLLLAINVVCVNLACKLVFLIQGIRPRTWWEKEKAKRAMTTYIIVWLVTLALLILVILWT